MTHEELKFLIKVTLAAAIGVTGPLVLAAYYETKSHAKSEKRMRGIYRSHVKVLDKSNAGGYRDAGPSAMLSDFDFFCIAEDFE